MLGAPTDVPFSRSRVFDVAYDAERVPLLRQHLIFGAPVVPAALQLSLGVAAARDALGAGSCELADLLFSRTVVADAPGTTVQWLVAREGDASATFQVASAADDAWTLHARGVMRRGAAAAGPAPVHELPQEVRRRCRTELPLGLVQQRLRRCEIHLGPDFQRGEAVWTGPGEALCTIRPAAPDGADLHPGLIDACFQLLYAVEPQLDGAWVPFHVERFRAFAPPPAPAESPELWGHLRLRPGQSDAAAADTVTFDAWLYDGSGRVLAEAGGVGARRITREQLRRGAPATAAASPRLYETRWQVLEPATGGGSGGARDALILCDRRGVGEALARRVRGAGGRALLVHQGTGFRDLGAGEYAIDSADPADYERLFAALDGEAPGWVVHLWSLDATAEVTAHSLERQQLAGSGSALHTVQALAQSYRGAAPRLWLVTSGAQGPAAPGGAAGVAQTPLWGLGEVVVQEHPELRCVRFDVDPDAPEAETLFRALLAQEAQGGEDRLAGRAGRLYGARLRPLAGPPAPAGPICRRDATYLVTGGLGALGLRVASWLVAGGARQIILAGRSPSGRQADEVVAALREAGAGVLVAQADVSRPADVERLVRAAGALPPIRGIFHLAGVIDDGLLLRQSWDRFWRVMAPKVQGAWNLHALSAQLPLDHFVLFSSVASLLGSPGQGNYAAANAFLDGLARYRRSVGLPAVSVNWGAWAEAGMAARMSERDRARWAGWGVRGLPPGEGLDLLGRLVHVETAQVGAVSLDWEQYFRSFPRAARSPYLQAVVAHRAVAGAEPPGTPDVLRAIEGAAPGRRRMVLERHVRERVRQHLRIRSIEQVQPGHRLFDLGIDSLIAMELRSSLEEDLGVPLRSTLVFDFPTVRGLVEHLSGELPALRIEQTGVGVAAPAAPRPAPPDPLAGLSGDQLRRLLADELSAGEAGA
jgi:NAD(P)-dependent dehydrogenase (short-subunit alcohol dehydrogenase family)/acyl carrier protein